MVQRGKNSRPLDSSDGNDLGLFGSDPAVSRTASNAQANMPTDNDDDDEEKWNNLSRRVSESGAQIFKTDFSGLETSSWDPKPLMSKFTEGLAQQVEVIGSLLFFIPRGKKGGGRIGALTTALHAH